MSGDGNSIPVKLRKRKGKNLLPENVFIMDLRKIDAKTKESIRVMTESIGQSRVAFCLERAKYIQTRLGKICGPDEMAYLDNLCTTFVKENNMEDIKVHISKIDKLQAAIQKYENKVISLSGIGSTYDSVNVVTKMVRKVSGNLEDIFCAVLLGVDEVESMWKAGKFAYQTGERR